MPMVNLTTQLDGLGFDLILAILLRNLPQGLSLRTYLSNVTPFI